MPQVLGKAQSSCKKIELENQVVYSSVSQISRYRSPFLAKNNVLCPIFYIRYVLSRFFLIFFNLNVDTKSISDMETMGGQEYKHVSFLFPFGKNVVTIQPASPVPEFPLPSLIMILTFLMAIVFFSFKGKGQLTTS